MNSLTGHGAWRFGWRALSCSSGIAKSWRGEFAALGSTTRPGFDTLLNAADHGDARAGRQLDRTAHHPFYRLLSSSRHFDLAAEHALWAVHRRGTALLWSAAAATGEEPYSLAMALIDIFKRNNPPVTILATDIDEDALAVARQGEYAEPAVSRLEADHRCDSSTRRGYAALAHQPGGSRPGGISRFEPDRSAWPLEGPFDVVFCRNVLMYLEACHRYAVLERIASVLAPEGILILDPTEHLGKAGHLFAHRADGIYSSRQRSCGGRELKQGDTGKFA